MPKPKQVLPQMGGPNLDSKPCEALVKGTSPEKGILNLGIPLSQVLIVIPDDLKDVPDPPKNSNPPGLGNLSWQPGTHQYQSPDESLGQWWKKT